MIKTARKKERHQKPLNVPPKIAYDINASLERIGLPNVYIGGRAVNAHSGGKERSSHDLDIALLYKPSNQQINLLTQNSHFSIENNPNMTSRYSLFYHSEELQGTGKIKIDLYYPGYVSSLYNFKPQHTLNGFPIAKIVMEGETITVDGSPLKVAKREMLVVMKYLAWENRGNGNKSSKDMVDITNMIRTNYNDSREFEGFVNILKEVLRTNMPNDEERIIHGILSNVDLKKINKDFVRIAREVIRK